MKRKRALTIAALGTLVGFAACETGSAPDGRSGVSVYLTDAPLDLAGVHEVNVTLSAITLYPVDAGSGDAGGIELTNGPISMPGDLKVNLLDFRNGQVSFLGSQSVPAGAYSRIRLQVVAADLVRDDDSDPATPDIVEAITVPSSKVDVPVPFELTTDETLAITVDFDAQASVQVNTTNGKQAYLLRPVINVVGMTSS